MPTSSAAAIELSRSKEGEKFGSIGLLVSVRNASEAAAALEAGADVIDIKEPARGPLGPADTTTVERIVDVVGGRRPVTAALGELADLDPPTLSQSGVTVVKVGLARLRETDWRDRLTRLRQQLSPDTQLAPAVYLDARTAQSPTPDDVLNAVVDEGGAWLVLDTWDKTGPSSLDIWSVEKLKRLIDRARLDDVQIVLAGGIGRVDFPRAVECGPALLGVRGAACGAGRSSPIEADRVRLLRDSLAASLQNR